MSSVLPPLRGLVSSRRLPTRALATLSALAILATLVVVLPAVRPAEAASGAVTGQVFNDYDVNGTRRTVADTAKNLRAEPGLGGVTVRAFDAEGTLVGETTTASDGTYTLAVTDASTNDLRVEFTVPDGFKPSFAFSGGSTIQFVTVGATNVNLGVQVPEDFCEANPLVACTLVEDTVGTFGSVRGFNWDNSGSEVPIATNTETGAVWGLAWHRQSGKLISAPTIRRNTKIYESPEGTPRPGQLFVSGRSAGTTELYVDVATLGVDVGTVPNFATRSTAVGGVIDGFAPNGTWDLTAKVGIGDIDVSDDGRFLWFVNLFDRKLYRLAIGDGRLTPVDELTAADVTGYTLPDPGCVGGVYRPWATGMHEDGRLFVGGVCTAENGGTRANLEAVVYSFDPTTETFGASPVLRFRLDYTKGNAHVGAFGNTNNRWYTWWETPTQSGDWFSNRGAMPILSDIEFSDDGAMTLGFLDRMAQRAQTFNSRTSGAGLPGRSAVTDWFWSAGGDTLRACTADEQTWQIEPLKPFITSRNCTIGGTTYFTSIAHTGQLSSEQEFYNDTVVNYAFQDFGGFIYEQGHLEGSLGGLATYPGATHVVATVYDPNQAFFTGGARWLSFANGSRRLLPTSTTGDRELVSESGSSASFGKTGGLGDVEVLCSNAPIQIGDRVWFDANGDGIQDAGETPIAGVTVRLYDSADELVAETITDANGQYRFSSTTDGLEPYTDYTIRFDNPDDYADGGPLAEYGPTVTAAGTDEGADADGSIDSNAELGGGTILGVDAFPEIAVAPLEAGESNHTFDVGFKVRGAEVGDRVWFDADGDGVQDPDERGLPGVTLAITNLDGSPVVDLDGNPVTTTTTDAEGNYLFENLPFGQYRVTATTPDGFTPTLSGVGDPDLDSSTGSAESSELTEDNLKDLTLDFGFTAPLVSVGDRVWVDLNRDGIQDPTESGIEGVTLSITKADGSPATDVYGDPIPPTTTDANGYYRFENLPAGSYTVTVTDPSGYVPTITGAGTSETDSSTGSATSANLDTDGASDLTLDFGFVVPKVGVGGRVRLDANRDGVPDEAESGVEGVTVTITNADGSPVTDVFGNPVTTTTTDADGNYRFENLPTGTYTLTMTTPAGFLNNGVTNVTSELLTVNDSSDLDLDFAVYPPSVSVGNRVWFDANADGIQDPDEPGIGGVTLTITNADGSPVTDVFGNPVTTTTTNSDGSYLFADLPFGEYVVAATGPDGFTATVPTSATSDELTANESSDLTLDFGFVAPRVSVGDRVWLDTNRDGIQDPGEPGLGGVTLTITNADGSPVTDVLGNLVTTTTTDVDGTYRFDDLPLGDYTVSVTDPEGFIPTLAGEGTVETGSSTGSVTSSDLAADGASDLTLDFGFVVPRVSVGGRVGIDKDRDGAPEPGSESIAGVVITITITNPDGSVVTDVFGDPVTTTTTDADGTYRFENLPAGTYTVTMTTPSGYLATETVATSASLTTDGTSDTSVDFGVYPPSVSVGDRVWFDVDRNGIQDAGEPGIAGVTLAITNPDGSAVTDVFGDPVTTTTTDAEGNYRFGNLPFGEYVVSVTDPDGYFATVTGAGTTETDSSTGSVTSANLTADGASDLTLDFGLVAPRVSVGDRVWLDSNRDGVQDSGEPGVEGAVLTITNADGTPVFDVFGAPVTTTTTDADGTYRFENLPIGTYKVTMTPPADLLPVGASDATSSALTEDEASDDTLDFAVFRPEVSVGDRVWLDTNRNGVQDDGEPGLEGVTLTITTPSGDPVTDVDGNLVTTTTTDANGDYLFERLPIGSYMVSVTDPEGYVPTVDGAGTAGTDSSTGSADSANLTTDGASDLTLDFGFVVPRVSVGDRVWLDVNRDGEQTLGEPGIAGVTLAISNPDGSAVTDVDGNLVTTTTTDANGYYRFENLPLGSYVVAVTDPPGVIPTLAGAGTTETDSSTGSATSVELLVNETSDLTLDFGFVAPRVSVGDRVWLDVSRDGVQDPGEPGMAGVTLSITNLDGSAVTDVFGNPVTTTTTDDDGNYLFENLPVGTYTVTVTAPDGYLPTLGGAGSTETDSSTGSATSVELTVDEASDGTLDFGFVVPKVSVGNVVWLDKDRDGVQDPDEPGMAGVTLAITSLDGSPVTDVFGNPVSTTTTDDDGNYLFENLPAGRYKVTMTTPEGYLAGGSTEQVSGLLTTDGAEDLLLDFGVFPPSVLVGDRVWHDVDRDGIQDPGEPGIAGVVLTITNADGSPVTDVFGNPVTTTTTDADGTYRFDRLPFGAYQVSVTYPEGYFVTPPGQGTPDVDSSTGSATSVELIADGEEDLTLDFGFYAPWVSVRSRVWVDTNGNGVEDPGEPGMAGVRLRITNADGSPAVDVFGNPVPDAFTDADGYFIFDLLPPGRYLVSVVGPDGYVSTTPSAVMSVELTADGDADLSPAFGFVPQAQPQDPSESPSGEPCATCGPGEPGSGEGGGLTGTLPVTGAPAWTVLLQALVLLVAGGFLVGSSRRRPSASSGRP